MKTFEIAVPITGWQVFHVKAESEQEATDMILGGEIDTDEFDEIAWELDTNKWDIEESAYDFDSSVEYLL